MKQADNTQDDPRNGVHTAGYERHHEEHANGHQGAGRKDEGPRLEVGNKFFHGNKRLKNLMLVPPGGWKWTCPRHGTKFKANFYPELRDAVRGYLVANRMGLPDNLDGWLQDCMCNQNGWGEETFQEV